MICPYDEQQCDWPKCIEPGSVYADQECLKNLYKKETTVNPQTSDVHHDDLHHDFNTPRDLCTQSDTEDLVPKLQESLRRAVKAKQESDPYGKNPHEPGAKLDQGKSPILQGVIQYFPRALREVAMVSLHGAQKYAWKGWEYVPDGINRYGNALGRHLLDEATEGEIDSASGLLHAAQEAWNALARLELILRQKEEK